MRRWFLSYTSQDLALAQTLKAALKRKDPNARIFFAPEDMRAGGFWKAQLAKEIAESTIFILLVGENGLGDWQVMEYFEALDRRAKDSDYPIILILSTKRPAPGAPPAFFLYIDQGEELYVRAEERERRRFSEVLAHGLDDQRLRALMSMRSDFLGELQNDQSLLDAHRQINLPPLREAQLYEVVSRPAEISVSKVRERSPCRDDRPADGRRIHQRCWCASAPVLSPRRHVDADGSAGRRRPSSTASGDGGGRGTGRASKYLPRTQSERRRCAAAGADAKACHGARRWRGNQTPGATLGIFGRRVAACV